MDSFKKNCLKESLFCVLEFSFIHSDLTKVLETGPWFSTLSWRTGYSETLLFPQCLSSPHSVSRSHAVSLFIFFFLSSVWSQIQSPALIPSSCLPSLGERFLTGFNVPLTLRLTQGYSEDLQTFLNRAVKYWKLPLGILNFYNLSFDLSLLRFFSFFIKNLAVRLHGIITACLVLFIISGNIH